MTIAIVIPARNEAASIGHLISALRSLPMPEPRVIVVDNFSDDGTADRAQWAGAHVIISDEPLPGIGPCLQLGMLHAVNENHERIVTMDAGGSHDPADLIALLATYNGLVIGSRFLPESRYVGRRYRAWCSRVVARACNAVTGADVSDWTSGYRVWTWLSALHAVETWPDTAMHGVQIATLGLALGSGTLVSEVPITYRAGRSSFGVRAAAEAAGVWWQFARRGRRAEARAWS